MAQNLLPTRADYILPTNLSANQLRSRSTRKLKTLRNKFEDISRDWADIDMSVDEAVCDVTNAIEALLQAINDAADYLNTTYED